jgi:uncharacterized protein YraI
MRRLVTILTLAVVLAGLLGPGAAITAPSALAQQIEPSTTAVTTDRLNLRSGPSAQDPVITVLPAGVTVTLSGQQIGDYLFLDWNGQKGWAHRDWLAIQAPPSSTSGTAVTTDALNLRTGPALSYEVISVLPAGTTVTLTGQETNGYRSVSWNGRDGWAFGAYLAQDLPTPSPNETAVTTDRLNLRSGPSLADGVRTVLPAGAPVTVTGPASNGFRPVTWGGYSGWAYETYLDFGGAAPPPQPEPEPQPGPQTNAVTTDELNLRAGPATSWRVLAVIPTNTRIVLTGESSGDYRAVSYNGQSGWAHAAWIAADGATPIPSGTATTTDRLNLRSGPATSYAVQTVIPSGAQVTLNGQTSNGFHSVTYDGVTGWAFSSYLSIGAAPPPPPPPDPEPVPFDVTNTIVGPPRGSAEQAIGFAQRAGANRIDQVELYIREVYRLAPQIGFDPALIVAQSALETNYWRDDWWSLRLNAAGLGITGDPAQESASPTFPNGTIAARAQLAHMHAEVFGNTRPLPTELQGVDPTYQRVFEAGWAGTIRTVEDLSGTWAVDPEYHHKIIRVAREIFGP